MTAETYFKWLGRNVKAIVKSKLFKGEVFLFFVHFSLIPLAALFNVFGFITWLLTEFFAFTYWYYTCVGDD